MSSKNNETSPETGFLVVGIVFMALLLFAVAAFISLCLTVLSLIAWKNPLTLGKITIEPYEARTFVCSGIAGMILIPLFAAFCCLLYNATIPHQYWSYLFLGGYVLGSLGVLFLMAQEAEAQTANPIIPLTLPPTPTAPPKTFLYDAPSFRFATWDDEEELK